MIYKNGVKANKIELIIADDDLEFICHIHLSNSKIFSGKPEKINPSIMFNKNALEAFSLLTIGTTLKKLNKEMEK